MVINGINGGINFNNLQKGGNSMKKVRLIIMGNQEGTREEVIFTEDFDVLGEDFCRPGLAIIFDKQIENNLPNCFPMESNLIKE